MKRMKKISLSLICCILVASILSSCDKNDYIASGKDGNITWKISKDGVLTISGKGDMPNYHNPSEFDSPKPWGKHYNLINSLVIEEGITSIGSSAFYNYDVLTGSLTLPEGITSIGFKAFTGCYGLTGSLNFPASLKYIGCHSFVDCSGFTGSLIFPDLTLIDCDAFRNCYGLTGSLNIPKGTTHIYWGTFSGCSGFNGTLTLPEELIHIGTNAFRDCSGFSNVISYSIEPPQIEFGAFEGVPINTIALHVPNISIEKYKTTEVWQDFGNIIAIENH